MPSSHAADVAFVMRSQRIRGPRQSKNDEVAEQGSFKHLQALVRVYPTVMRGVVPVQDRVRALCRWRDVPASGASVRRAQERGAWLANQPQATAFPQPPAPP